MNFNYPSTLPVTAHRREILEALQNNQVIVVAGDTGSGKTTQIPKISLEHLQREDARIGCTQPRRIAAQTVAARVKEELGDAGALVGYKIRFHDRTSAATRIKFMTDGVLLAEARRDRYLKEYDIVMIDEAHERSLNIDFLLGHLKNILHKRKDLKIIITSATIDTAAFASHFNNAPIINISGKTYPVEVRYLPPTTDEYGEQESYVENCVKAATRLAKTELPGDMLVFLPTERDIRACCELLRKRKVEAEILPLFGRLHSADQQKIFQPSKKTKIVVATNVAETSITVPGIRYVIDSGLARIPFYNHRARTNSLPIRKISKASCNQRRGRCGRVGPGICLRLYDEDDFLQRDEFSIPEIKRSNLAEVILQMRTFSLGDPYKFPFLDPPQVTAIREGYRHLYELGAITEKKKLTKTGRMMAAMPIDPCISRIIIEAGKNDCLPEVLVIASVLAIQDPRMRPAEYEKQADDAHEQFLHPLSDFMSFLNIWNRFHHVKTKTSWSKLKKFCKVNFLSFQRMREWIDLHDQLVKIVKNHSAFSLNSDSADYAAIHKSLTVGFLRNIALKKQKRLYQGASGKELMIFPGSNLFSKSPQWLVASSFLETNRLYALHVAAIEPDWLESIAGKLCSYTWSNPRYHKKTGRVMADERVSLFGLVIIPARRVNFGKTSEKNRKEARNIFIQSALVEQQLIGDYSFLKHNEMMLTYWEEMEDRLRTKGLLVSEDLIYHFYQETLPPPVYDRATLNKALQAPDLSSALRLREEDIVQRRPQGEELANFPPTLNIGSHDFTLSYCFEPTSEEDGVTIRIPVELADTLRSETFEWLVPGLLREKTATLLKGLPKKIRKRLVPLNVTVDTILDDIELYKGSFYKALESSILKQFRISVQRSDWPAELPKHLLMRFELYDVSGKVISFGRDFSHLTKRSRKQPTLSKELAGGQELKTIEKWETLTTNTWAFSGLPGNLPVFSKGGEIAGYLYPALCVLEDQQAVTLKFYSKIEEVKKKNCEGLRYLFRLEFGQQYKALRKYCSTSLSGPSSLWLVELFSGKARAVQSILDFTIDTLFPTRVGKIPTQEDYEKSVQTVKKADFYALGRELCDSIFLILRRRRELLTEILRHEKLAKQSRSHAAGGYSEYKELLDDLLPSDFLDCFDADDLEDAERYMKSLNIRINRAHSDMAKDRKKAAPLESHVNNLQSLKRKKPNLSEECAVKAKDYEKMIQEYRISLFSPELKTKFAVSEKRLSKLWREIHTIC